MSEISLGALLIILNIPKDFVLICKIIYINFPFESKDQ